MALSFLDPIDFPVDGILKSRLLYIFKPFEEIESVEIRYSGVNKSGMQLFEEGL